MLKAYRNLDLRQSGVDSVGRLTHGDLQSVMRILAQDQGFQDIHENNLDMALAREHGTNYYQVIITLRNKEIPSPDPALPDHAIVGVMIGHIGTDDDKNALSVFSALRPAAALFPKVIRKLRSLRSFIVIDSIANSSRYSYASMTAFLLRKFQESKYGSMFTFLCYHGETVDMRVGNQLVKFGYHLFGIGDHGTLSSPSITSTSCVALFAIRTHDSREGI
jgi:hypothetical protein